MENWRLILSCYGAAAIVAALFFLIKIIRLRKHSGAPKTRWQEEWRLFLLGMRIILIILAVMVLHIGYLCGDIMTGMPVVLVLLVLIMFLSIL